MQETIISLVRQFLTPDIVTRMASASGISESADARKTIAGAVPAILSVLAGMASRPDGARQLADTIAQQPSNMLENLAGMVGGAGQLANIGKTALTTLLGSNTTNALASALSRFGGVGEEPARSLLSMLMPVVLGALGRQAGTGAGAVAQLLEQQKDSIAGAMPPQLSDLMRASGMLDTAAAVSNAARRASPTYASPGTARVADVPSPSRSSGSPGRWLLWAIPALALLGLGWYFFGDQGTGRRDIASPPQAFRPGEQATVAAAELQPQIAAAIESLNHTLQGVKDAASAAQALPKLQQASAELDRLAALANRLPLEARDRLAEAIKAANAKLRGALDNVAAIPGLAADIPPVLAALRARADALAMTPAALAQRREGVTLERITYFRRTPSGAILLSTYFDRGVHNRAGEKIGAVNDLILAPDARIAAAVLGVGSFLGMGEKEVAVPFSLIEVVRRDNDWHLVVDASKDALKEAPAYEDTAARVRLSPGSGNKR
jgi:hypothetical protein